MILFANVRRRMAKIEVICERLCRGVFKRVDENRELLELLQQEAPDFVERHPWIEGWLESQDEFLVQIADAAGTKNRVGEKVSIAYPRAWPGKRTEAERASFNYAELSEHVGTMQGAAVVGHREASQHLHEDETGEHEHAWSITARLAKLPASVSALAGADLARLVQEARDLHPAMAIVPFAGASTMTIQLCISMVIAEVGAAMSELAAHQGAIFRLGLSLKHQAGIFQMTGAAQQHGLAEVLQAVRNAREEARLNPLANLN